TQASSTGKLAQMFGPRSVRILRNSMGVFVLVDAGEGGDCSAGALVAASCRWGNRRRVRRRRARERPARPSKRSERLLTRFGVCYPKVGWLVAARVFSLQTLVVSSSSPPLFARRPSFCGRQVL